MLIQTEKSGLVRDTESKALLATNRKEIDEYAAKKALLQKTKSQENEINIIKQEMSSLKSDLSEIKELLKGLIK